MNGFGLLEALSSDFRHALRQLFKDPGFAAVALLVLALGIGLNSAMFSVIYSVLLRPLPYHQPDRIVHLVRVSGGTDSATIDEYDFLKAHGRVFSSVTGLRGTSEQRLISGADHQWITTLTVSTDFLRTLSVIPALGREFSSAEAKTGGPQAIVLSYPLWRDHFGSDRGVLGRAVTLDQTSYIVVGVLPASFWFPHAGDALIPLRPTGSLTDTGSNTEVLARLKNGVTVLEARAEMRVLTDQFRRDHRESAQYRGLTVLPYRAWLVGDVRLNLLMLFGATVLVLLIACCNLAVLLLTRFQARQKEFAVRLALGCGRARLLVQHLVENLLLAALGSIAGLGLAIALIKALVVTVPFELPTASPIHLSASVLGFAILLALCIALTFTFVPLLAARSLKVGEMLKSAGRTSAGAVRARGRSILIVSEVALSTILLIGAGLLIQSLYRLSREQLGFDPHGIVTFETPFAPARANTPADRKSYTQAMFDRLRAMPGVDEVAASNVIPLVGFGNLPTQREGHNEQSIGGMEVRSVSPVFFKALHIAVRRGRTFSDLDTASAPPVAVINETLAKVWYSRDNPLGDRVVIGRYQGQEYLKDVPRDIVGVAADTKTILKETPWPTVFVPLAQSDSLSNTSLRWIVRFRNDSIHGEDLRRAAVAVDPEQRIRQFESMDDIVTTSTASSRFNALLFTLFGAGALALAAVGVYGLVAFLVAQRRHEIGTRMAVGAGRPDILGLFVREGLLLTVAGLGLGLVGAYLTTRFMAGLLFSVQAHDAFTFLVAPLVLLVASLLAALIPAYRASRTDPMIVLRYE